MSARSADAGPMSRRRFLSCAAALGALGASAGLSGCASSSGGQPLAGQPLDSKLYPLAEAERLNRSLTWPRGIGDPSEKTRIVVAHTWTADFWPRQMQFDKFFMERHPTIEVTTENTPGADYEDKYVIQGTGGTLPDVMYAQWAFAQLFVQAGKFAELDGYMARQPGFDLADFTKPALGCYQSGGRTYGLAYDCGPVMLVYNKDIFDRAHVAYPSADWTMDDLAAAAARLVSGSGGDRIYGMGGFPDLSLPYAPPLYLQPFGARFLNSAQTQCELLDPRAESTMRWWAEAMRGVTPTLGEVQAMQATSIDAFIGGRAAMDIGGSWLAPTLQEAGFRFGFTNWPKGPAGRCTSVVGSCYAITSDCTKRDAAWIYLNEYTSTAGLTFMFSTTGHGSPARGSAWPAYLDSSLAPDGAHLIYEALNSYATTDGIIDMPTGPKITDLVKPIWDNVQQGGTSVDSGLRQIRQAVAPVLLENRA